MLLIKRGRPAVSGITVRPNLTRQATAGMAWAGELLSDALVASDYLSLLRWCSQVGLETYNIKDFGFGALVGFGCIPGLEWYYGGVPLRLWLTRELFPNAKAFAHKLFAYGWAQAGSVYSSADLAAFNAQYIQVQIVYGALIETPLDIIPGSNWQWYGGGVGPNSPYRDLLLRA